MEEEYKKVMAPVVVVNDYCLMITDLFLDFPDLPNKIRDLFLIEGAPYKHSGLFEYLFTFASTPAPGTKHSYVGYRIRTKDERESALGTLDRREFIGEEDHGMLQIIS